MEKQKRGQILPDGVYYKLAFGDEVIKVVDGRVMWLGYSAYEDYGNANKTNIDKAIREAKKIEKYITESI